MLAADVASNIAIGDYGAKRILEITGKKTIFWLKFLFLNSDGPQFLPSFSVEE